MAKCKKCLEKIEKCEDCGYPFLPDNTYVFKPNDIRDNNCLHDNCSGCRSGTCSGVHMIACPCPKCSPRM